MQGQERERELFVAQNFLFSGCKFELFFSLASPKRKEGERKREKGGAEREEFVVQRRKSTDFFPDFSPVWLSGVNWQNRSLIGFGGWFLVCTFSLLKRKEIAIVGSKNLSRQQNSFGISVHRDPYTHCG